MPWFKIDDGFHGHPKVIGLSTSAIGLWTLAGTWAAQYLTDGDVPLAMIGRLNGTKDDADALVAAGLWIASPDGYAFHDWSEYQPDAASTKMKRDAESEGGARGNHTRWHERRGVVVEGCEFCKGSGTRSANDRVGDRVPDEAPDQGPDVVPDSPPNPPVPVPVPDPSFSNEKEEFSSVIAVATPRPDVDRLLDLLESEVVANGGKAPARTGKNRDAMRLLLDKDGRTVEQVESAIRWCQADEFWRANILSASKLREKFDQLRLSAARSPRSSVSRAEERQRHNLSVVAQLAAMDAAERLGLEA